MRCINEYLNEYRENKVVIWGTGNNAVECKRILTEHGIDIWAYCDNLKEKWGTVYEEVVVLSPHELFELCKIENVILLIANYSYAESIREQVREYNLKKVILFQELYKMNACYEIARLYNLEESYIIEVVDSNYDELKENFIHHISCVERLLYKLENIIPELKKKYGISVCAILKDEGAYIIEWLEFHRLIGIEHFYLYDNGSTDGLEDIIRAYIDDGIVTYIKWPGKAQQIPVYNNAIEKYKLESKYIAFIDIDEFLFPVEEENIFKVVDEIFSTHIMAGGIGVNWRVYGTSFHEEKVPDLVIENYKYRAVDLHGENRHIKTICNPRRCVGFRNPHAINYKENYYCISEHGSYIPDAFFYDGMCKRLRINHYVTKSCEKYRSRIRRGKASGKVYNNIQIEEMLTRYNKDYNELYDSIMDKYIERVKVNIENYGLHRAR